MSQDDHFRLTTLDLRNPVSSAKRAIALRCGGNSFNSRSVSFSLSHQTRLDFSGNALIVGTLSIHSHSDFALLSIERNTDNILLVVELATPDSILAALILSQTTLLMSLNLLSFRC